MPSDKDKVIAKVLRARQKPLRRCLTYHHCFYCDQPIFLGETYYDGGYNNRIHESCCAKASNEMSKDYTNAIS